MSLFNQWLTAYITVFEDWLVIAYIICFCIVIITALDIIRFVREKRKKLDETEKVKEKKGIE